MDYRCRVQHRRRIHPVVHLAGHRLTPLTPSSSPTSRTEHMMSSSSQHPLRSQNACRTSALSDPSTSQPGHEPSKPQAHDVVHFEIGEPDSPPRKHRRCRRQGHARRRNVLHRVRRHRRRLGAQPPGTSIRAGFDIRPARHLRTRQQERPLLHLAGPDRTRRPMIIRTRNTHLPRALVEFLGCRAVPGAAR